MIKYYNRITGNYEIEKVAGEKYLKWTYESPIGMSFLELLVKKKFFSKLYGLYCDSSLSKIKIKKFVEEFNIDMNLFEKKINDYTSFNDFFIRKTKNTVKPTNMNTDILISPGDGRLMVYENINLDKVVQIKGFTYSLLELIQDTKIAEKYKNGTCLILRLCPTDYHRFHFIDNGICENTNKISGAYYSVSPIALNKIPELFCKNKREWSLFHSENFGDILHIEVGATCVGSIIQTYKPNSSIFKGNEKGYFKFGGSTTILFFEHNTIKIDEDILNQSLLGYETKICFGENIGCKFK